jgi:phosphonate transport system substrate-binding protein
MLRKLTTVFLCLGLSVFFPLPAQGENAPGDSKIVLASLPSIKSDALSSAEKSQIASHLEAELHRKVEILFPEHYSDVYKGLKDGSIDVAIMGCWPASVLIKQSGADIILNESRKADEGNSQTEVAEYYSYWVVRKDSPYQSLKDLKGKKAVMTKTADGFLAPVAKLLDLGLIHKDDAKPANPADFFSQVSYVPHYHVAWDSVKSGKADVAVIGERESEDLSQEIMQEGRILEKQSGPSRLVVVSKHVDNATRQELIKAFIALNDSKNQSLMQKFISWNFHRFRACGLDGLDLLRDLQEKTGIQHT